MASNFDLVVRGGTIVDGSGAPVFKGDVAITAGVIRQVGDVQGTGRQEIDASGKLVTPGFVDVHTHYDGQVTWESRLAPSSEHGVTTVVMGNCGVGFAPCRPEQREMLVKVMEGVEDVPEIVMTTGIPWQWQSFAEYLEFLAQRRFDADCAAFLPHAALRVFVMEERGARGEPSTHEDRQRMTAMVSEAMKAGAIGISTSRTLFHRDSDNNLAPHIRSGRLELLALAEGLRDAGSGVFQLVPGLVNQQLKNVVPGAGELEPEEEIRQELALMREIVEVSGRPLSFSLLDLHEAPEMCAKILEQVADANRAGIEIKAQIFPRPVGLLFSLDFSLHPFSLHPSYVEIKDLPLAERLARLRSPDMKARLLAEKSDPESRDPIKKFLVQRSLASYVWQEEPNYEPQDEASLAVIATSRGISVWEAAYDALIAGSGKSILYLPMSNFSNNSLDTVYSMLSHPDTLLGLGDGGAHYGLICDASYTTFMLTYWARDRKGDRLSIPAAVNALTRRNALAVGLDDRGLIAAGMKADINIIDHDRLHLDAPRALYDLPAQGRRIVQHAAGYVATILNGEVTYRDGLPTEALPGRVVRAAPHLPDPLLKAA